MLFLLFWFWKNPGTSHKNYVAVPCTTVVSQCFGSWLIGRAAHAALDHVNYLLESFLDRGGWDALFNNFQTPRQGVKETAGSVFLLLLRHSSSLIKVKCSVSEVPRYCASIWRRFQFGEAIMDFGQDSFEGKRGFSRESARSYLRTRLPFKA
jgi:hypothetical protein